MKDREIVVSDPSGAADCNCMTGCLKGDHQYVALWRQGVVRWANSPSTEKTLIKKEKEEIMSQINTMKTNSKRRKARQLDKEALIDIERHWSIQDFRKIHKRLNDVRRPFEPQLAYVEPRTGTY
jgi:hypothetical protein